MDYNTLSDYCKEYLGRKEGEKDAYYLILTDCLKNPYLLNKPQATVTATTYNGRDYSAVFDAKYYYDQYPDLQEAIGYHPAELLRHFVEYGMNEGRHGNDTFSIENYIQETDQQILSQQLSSEMYQALDAKKTEPLGKYSYSIASYYGRYLEHYDYSAIDDEISQEEW